MSTLITDVKVILTAPEGINLLVVKVETNQPGLYGLGCGTFAYRHLAVKCLIEEYLRPLVVGRDVHAIEEIWQLMHQNAYWRNGPIENNAISGIDMALWDIKGKLANMPLYQLLGGRSRTGVMVYGHANGRDTAETVDEVLRHKEEGYLAIRAQSGVPGLNKVYGVSGANRMYEPADGNLPSEHDWSTEKYLRHTPGLFEAVREAVGPDIHLLHDVHHRLTPIEAGQLGKALEPVRMFWMEDPTPAENQDAFQWIRHHTTTPIAVGEIFNSIWDCKTLIEKQLIDYIRTTVVHAGGITHLRRIADLANLYRLTIPATLTDPWTVTAITPAGVTLGTAYVLGKRWSYIPALQSFVCKFTGATAHQIYRP